MYFTDAGFRPGIYRSRLDGSEKQTLVNTDTHSPTGLTIGQFDLSLKPFVFVRAYLYSQLDETKNIASVCISVSQT